LIASGDSDPVYDKFGFSVSIDSTGDTIVIGAVNDEENGNYAGSAYVFQSSSSGFEQIEKLKANELADTSLDYFGHAVEVNSAGDLISVVATSNDENGLNAGAVYIFKLTRDY